MKKTYVITFIVAILISGLSFAQAADGVDSFKQDKDSWRRKEQTTVATKNEIIAKIKDNISAYGLNNITQAEQIFCYTVDKPPIDYNGYTMNGMALTGFCGVLGKSDKDLFINEFFHNENSTSNIVAKCVIEPKVMLRFIKGVDYTDVLLSAPCHSFSVFYGGKIKSFNAEPASKIIEAFIQVYTKRKTDFISPALLNQVLPIGIAKTAEQKALIKEKSGDAPIRNWDSKQTNINNSQNSAPKKGWNRLKR